MPVNILNIPMFDGSVGQAVEYILKGCSLDRERMKRLISATGAHGLVTAQKQPGFARTLREFDLNLPDGMPAVWLGWLKGSKQMERCYGPDIFARVMIGSASTHIRHFLCGGKEGVAARLSDACALRFGNRNCVGVYCPPFRPMTLEEMKSLAKEINRLNVDIVWIGLSTPKQELFACELAKLIEVHFVITVGAAFDFHIGSVRQAPQIIQRAGLEWLFRLMMEPRRLYRRYLEIVPYFLYYGIKDLLTTSFSNS